jgi:hypothetical protein
MAEQTLTDLQNRQADQLANAYSSGVEKELTNRIAELEHMYSAAHSGLVSFLTLLDPGFIEEWIKSGKSISKLDDRFVQMRVTELLKDLHDKVVQAAKPDNGQMRIVQDKLEKVIREKNELAEEITRVKVNLRELESENKNLQAQLSVNQQVWKSKQVIDATFSDKKDVLVELPIERGLTEPDWMIEWRGKKTFERDTRILLLIGETGISRRPLLVKTSAQRLGINPENSSIGDAINRIADRGLIERIELTERRGSETGGVLPYFYRLTEQGRLAYWLLTGQNAKECEIDTLIRVHKSPEHSLLNLKVKEFLEESGLYQVTLISPILTLPDGHKFEPDITATEIASGEVIYIEVEREANKDRRTRVQKWQNLYAASNGKIHVVCDKAGFMKELLSEINAALSGLRFSTFISNMEEIENSFKTKGRIWLKERG